MPARSKGKINKTSENDENQNSIILKIIDSILDDNEKEFNSIILQKTSNDPNFKLSITLKKYKLPKILCSQPSIASLCAFFGAEKCFNSFSMLYSSEKNSSSFDQIDNNSRSILHFACAGGNLNIIREIEQKNIDINAKDAENMTPICYAAMMGHLNVIKYLWTKGATILLPSSNDLSPFHIACQHGNLEIAKFLYDTFLSDNIQAAKMLFQPKLKRNTTPLHLACEGGHSDIVQYLASMDELFKIQANSYDGYLRTPAVVACQNGSLNCLKILSQKGEVTFDIQKNIFLPLVEASINGHLDVVKFLLSRPDVQKNIQKDNTQKLNAIQAAVKGRYIEIIRLLIEKGAIQNYDNLKIGDLMTIAFNSLDLKIIKLFDKNCQIPYNERINEKDITTTTTWGDKFMQISCLNEKEDFVTFLLNKKCNFNHVDLSTNVKHEWSNFLDFLIKNGVDLSINPIDKKPLIVFTLSTGNLRRVKKMIKKGAILTKEIINDFNLIYETCKLKKIELFKFLFNYEPIIDNADECIDLCITKTKEAKIKNDIKTVDIYYFMIEKLLSSQKVDVNKKNCKFVGNSLLSHAASDCCIEILKLFESNGADFVNCILEIKKMNNEYYLPILQFFKNRGCKFIQSSPILDSLFCECQHRLNSKILILLLDFIPNNEIINFYNYCGNISDIAMRNGLDDALLMIYKKVNKVILPKNCNKEFFFNWIANCDSPELEEFVNKYIDV